MAPPAAFFETMAVIGTTLFTAALVPQLVRTWRLGHAQDISVWFLLTVIAASFCSGVWAIWLPNYIVATGFAANVVVWGYVLKVRLRPKAGKRANDVASGQP